MRYTYWHALRTPASPLVLYASFNRYLHLEPLLKRSTDALTRFHSRVLANLLLSCFQWLGTFGLRLHHGLLRRGISALTRRITSLAISRTIRPEKCVRIYRGGARVIRLDSFGEGHPSPSEVD